MSALGSIRSLLEKAVNEKASDVHLRADQPPRIRIHDELLPVRGFIPTNEDMWAFVRSILDEEGVRHFERVLEYDLSYVFDDLCRVRVNLYQQRQKICASMRIIPRFIPSMQQIGLDLNLAQKLTSLHKGLVLVTGATGAGKSTTLAALIEHINKTRRCHILTIEDPIEYYYTEDKAMISQRELNQDTRTFAAALRHSFRQDPDVVLLGEMRDPETMQIALTLAETGHLTFSTLHTGDVMQTITRIVDAMPPHQRDHIRAQLSNSLSAVISQRLVPSKKGGLVAAREVLVCNRAIRNLIREDRTNQLLSAMQTGVEEGMITLSAALAELVRNGTIEWDVGYRAAEDPKDFATKAGTRI